MSSSEMGSLETWPMRQFRSVKGAGRVSKIHIRRKIPAVLAKSKRMCDCARDAVEKSRSLRRPAIADSKLARGVPKSMGQAG